MVNMYMNTPFSFQEIEDCSNGKKYLVTVKIPMSIGWIDDVLLYLDVGERTYEIPLGHVGNDSEYASFSNDLFLENRYLYSYYFSFKSNDHKYFITKNGVKSSVEYYEKFKESVGFSSIAFLKICSGVNSSCSSAKWSPRTNFIRNK